MPASSETAAAGDSVRRGFGRKHIILILAGTLTVAMLGWQGWHIYQSYQAVAHKESGKCATKLVEEVYFAATLHGNPDIQTLAVQGHASDDEKDAWALAGHRAAAVVDSS